MDEQGSKRKRYPAKISIVNVTTEMREELDEVLKEHSVLTEAEFVREAIELNLARYKRLKKKGKGE